MAKSDLQPGDLVYLDTKGDDGIIDHAAIYIGCLLYTSDAADE